MFEESDWKPNPNDLREDGSQKGKGYFGTLKRLDNPKRVSGEISIGTDWGKGEKTIPSMVPTLNKKELEYLLSTPEDQIHKVNPEIYKSISSKAIEHAISREQKGLPYFAKEGEQQSFPNLKAIHDNSFIEKLKERAGLK